MPVVTVEWLEGRTPQQKQELAKAVTDAFVKVTSVAPEQVWIVFKDVARANWAMSGKLLDQPRG